MNLKNAVPDYVIERSNTTIQIVFTSIFAFVFINIYKPFGSGHWYNVNEGKFLFYSALLVLWGMLVVVISRTIMTQIRKKFAITIGNYLLMVLAEIVFMAAFFMLIEVFVLKDARFWGEIFYNAVQNTALIILIPYTISILFFANQEKKKNMEDLMKNKSQEESFVSFFDESNVLKITIKSQDLLYLESSENYVDIYYLKEGKLQKYVLRSSMKRLENKLADMGLIRCHRSFMVNQKRVHHLRKDGSVYKLCLDASGLPEIAVSRTYTTSVLEKLSEK